MEQDTEHDTPRQSVVFHGGLKDFLHSGNSPGKVPALGPARLSYPLDRRASVKDVIEALGPPHTEVGRILAHEFGQMREENFHLLLDPRGRRPDRVEVFPVVAPWDPTQHSMLRPALPALRFAVDANVGKLATLLRMLGFDTAYDRSLDDAGLAELAARERRVVLSKDRALLKRAAVTHGRCIRHEDPEEQLLEVLCLFGLRPPFATFSRCLRCNVPLRPVDKAEIEHRLLPKTRAYYHDFSLCPECDRIYWAGSHQERMQERVARLLGRGCNI
jgi:hypothetical protein